MNYQISTKDFMQSLTELMKTNAFKEVKTLIEGENALLFLLLQQKSMSPSDIAHDLGITRGRVTSLINSLSEKEFIDVSISSEDRRSFNIDLTPDGEKFILPKVQNAESYFDKMITSIGQEKTKFLIELINEITEEMEGLE